MTRVCTEFIAPNQSALSRLREIIHVKAKNKIRDNKRMIMNPIKLFNIGTVQLQESRVKTVHRYTLTR